MYILVRHNSHKASTTSSHKDKALRVKPDVLVYVVSRESLAVLLNQRHFVLLSDKALCASSVIATVQL